MNNNKYDYVFFNEKMEQIAKDLDTLNFGEKSWFIKKYFNFNSAQLKDMLAGSNMDAYLKFINNPEENKKCFQFVEDDYVKIMSSKNGRWYGNVYKNKGKITIQIIED